MTPHTPAEIRDALTILCENAANDVTHQRATYGEGSDHHYHAQRVAYAYMDALTAIESGIELRARKVGVA